MEEHECCDNELDGLWLLLHRAQENLEPIGKDANCIFYDPPGSGKPVVQYALWPRHTPEAVRLHHSGRRVKASSPMRVEGEVIRGWGGTRLYNPWPHSVCTPRTR